MDPANNSCEDEELAELRLAALATLKANITKKSEPESLGLTDIATSVPSTYSSHFPNDTTQYGRRNPTQPPRRGGRGRPFPKLNQRSNLIVITPVNLGEKSEGPRGAAPQLVLPQHKWCNAVNEDSSSPKIDRRTGPTRFNRHESRSDSSESDYDNSDNDSYSNETILQDEHSEHFAQLTPEDSMERRELHRQQSSEQRLSFQNIDSNLNSMPKDDTESKVESLNSVSKESDSGRCYAGCNQYNLLVNSTQVVGTSNMDEVKTSASINGESCSKRDILSGCGQTDSTKVKKDAEESGPMNGGGEVQRSYVNRNRLSETDLRLELKKRMQEFKSSDRPLEQKEYGDRDLIACGMNYRQNQSPECSEKQSFTCSSELSERQIRTSVRKRIEAPSYSPQNRREYVSSSKRNLDTNCTTGYNKEHSSADNGRQRDHSRSSSKGAKRDRSVSHRSSDRSHKKNNHHSLHPHSHSPNTIQNRISSPNRRSLSSDKSRKADQNSTKKPCRSTVSVKESHRRRRSSSSSTSSSSSSSTSSSNSSSKRQFRSVPSVIQSVIRPPDNRGLNVGSGEKRASSETDFISPKKGKSSDEICSSLSSSIRVPNYGGGENRNNAPDGSKRMPVHMRLGTLPRKRVIQMTKDVEAAFVNTSTDEEENDFCVRGKKQNFRVVTELCGSKMDDVSKRRIEKSPFKAVDVSRDKTRRTKIHR